VSRWRDILFGSSSGQVDSAAYRRARALDEDSSIEAEEYKEHLDDSGASFGEAEHPRAQVERELAGKLREFDRRERELDQMREARARLGKAGPSLSRIARREAELDVLDEAITFLWGAAKPPAVNGEEVGPDEPIPCRGGCGKILERRAGYSTSYYCSSLDLSRPGCWEIGTGKLERPAPDPELTRLQKLVERVR
jgi:hypothetical protein